MSLAAWLHPNVFKSGNLMCELVTQDKYTHFKSAVFLLVVFISQEKVI